MMRKLFSLFFLLLFTTALMAQNSISDINKIKRDKSYLYGEATLDKKESAIDLAYELLKVEIKNWAKSKDPKISSVLASKVYEYADTIILHRHNMIRAFVYVRTSNLKAIKGKKLNVDIIPDESLTKPVVENQIEEIPDDKTIQIEESASVDEQSSQIAIEPEAALPPKTVTDEVLERLMEIESFYDLEKTMKPLKDQGKIEAYGKYTTMTNPAQCYLIIYDQQADIRAFLDKGESSRKNLKTGLDDSEKNYHGCGAIWFKVKD